MELQKHYAKGSLDREKLETAVRVLKAKSPLEVPLVVGGKEVGFAIPGPALRNR